MILSKKYTYETNQKFQQEEDRQALLAMKEVHYKKNIKEMLLQLENLNLKGRMSGVNWKPRVEDNLLVDIC